MLSLTPNRVGCEAMAATRRLTAILAADVAGYSRLMGDFLAEFASIVDAVRRLRSLPCGPGVP
jgi:hypothetical protein